MATIEARLERLEQLAQRSRLEPLAGHVVGTDGPSITRCLKTPEIAPWPSLSAFYADQHRHWRDRATCLDLNCPHRDVCRATLASQ